MTRSNRRARRRLRRFVAGAVVLAVVGSTLTTVAIATDAFGAGEKWLHVVNRVERFLAGPQTRECSEG